MSQERVTIQETLKKLVDSKRYSTVKDVLKTINASDIAAVFDSLSNEQLPVAFRLLPRDLAAETFIEMNSDSQELLIKSFSDSELKQVVDDLYADDATDLVEEMPANVAKRILSQADPSLRKTINQLLNYPEDSAGTIMTTEYVELNERMNVRQAMDHIREVGIDKETIYTCYVTKRSVLVGCVSAKDLMTAKDPETSITSLMDSQVITVDTVTDREQVASLIMKYNLLAIPVVDAEGRMAGIITVDDVIDVIQTEATEDITIMSGQTPYEKTYSHSSPLDLYLHRIPWLLILMISATFTGMIITNFETALAAQVVLTAFIPMLMDTGGNSGSQSSVTVIRAISLGEIEFRDLPKVIGKEIVTALLCGLTLGAVCFGKIVLVDRILMHNPDVTLTVALSVCITMTVTVVAAKIVGCSLPLVAKKLGFDPAVMSSPFITTIVDALSLLLYFSIATALLSL